MADDTITQALTEEIPAAPAQLQLADILLATQVVHLATSRGAFKVEEFTQIGGLYERLVGFLQASGAIQPAPSVPSTEETQGN